MADRVFGPHTNSDEVYEVAAKPVVKAAMEGVNGMKGFKDLYHYPNGNVMFLAVSDLVAIATIESFYFFILETYILRFDGSCFSFNCVSS